MVDFVQTVVKGALTGYAMGCGAAVLAAIAIDRSPFLTRGLLPVGNFVAALPIVGVAPIMVMWFGFDWQSKAAVVVAMVFFPMLVNTVPGSRPPTHAARPDAHLRGELWQTLLKLRLPAAMPFIFNGLKIATTLALIGAIVAEFFGSPIKGMGFRISTSVGQLAIDMVWAEIVVAALAGSHSTAGCPDREGGDILAPVTTGPGITKTQTATRETDMKTLAKTIGLAAAGLWAGMAQAADDLTLQLKWVTQAQFAGYYVAQDQGFYAEEDLTSRSSRAAPTSPHPGDRGRRRRCGRRMDARRAGGARKGPAAGQYRPALQALGHDADLPEIHRHRPAPRISAAARSASGSSATNTRS